MAHMYARTDTGQTPIESPWSTTDTLEAHSVSSRYLAETSPLGPAPAPCQRQRATMHDRERQREIERVKERQQATTRKIEMASID